MATKKKDRSMEKVELTLPLIPGLLEDDVFVSVNCKTYLIQRGKTVKVPRAVVEVVKNSEIATTEALAYIKAALEAKKKDEKTLEIV